MRPGVLVRADAAALLAWGLPRLRDLPWRRTRDPWAVLASEVMLQQTQVARVIPKWQSFLTAYPSPEACAAAPLAEVLRLWHGLGYPRRAANLQAAAAQIAALGSVPSTLDGLLALPGIGPYTARAVLAFAFEIDAAVVDTNVARVCARRAGRPLTRREVQAEADAVLPPGQAWAWNQCLLDLGATLCRPGRPFCGDCPIALGCSWRGAGDDPAIGTAGVSGRQSRFAGSDRQARGRILGRLVQGATDRETLAAAAGRSDADTARLIGDLAAEGLLAVDGGTIRLPRRGD